MQEVEEMMAAFQRISSEFGAWNATPACPSVLTTAESTSNDADAVSPLHCPFSFQWTPPPVSPALPPIYQQQHQQQPDSPLTKFAMSGGKPRRFFQAHSRFHSHTHHLQGIRRYSKIDDFIEGLDAACETLPAPLIGSCARSHPRLGKDVSSAPPSAAKDWSLSIRLNHRRTSCVDNVLPIPTSKRSKEVKFADQVREIDEGQNILGPEAAGSNSMLLSRKNARDSATLIMDIKSSASGLDYFGPHESTCRKRSQPIRAATKLQSTYRGYRVRKGQLLKYLLAISGMKAKLEERKDQFEAWKIAAWFPTDFTERVTMTEGLTDLLEQLDALQGAPFVVKDFRNSVRREVLKFQEEVENFLCQNSKHAVLFDLARPNRTSKTTMQRHKYPKFSSKASKRTSGKKDSISVEDGVSSDPHVCTKRSSTKTGGGGPAPSDPTFKPENDRRHKVSAEGSQHHHHSGGSTKSQAFPSWPPSINFQSSSKEEPLQSITELKKCVAPFSNFDIYTPPKTKNKSHWVTFSTANIGNRNYWKDYLAMDSDHSTLAPVDEMKFYSRVLAETSNSSIHLHQKESKGLCQNRKQREGLPCAGSIIKQKNPDGNASVRFFIPTDFRIANLQDEKLEESSQANYHSPLANADHSSNESNNSGLDGISKRSGKETGFPSAVNSSGIIESDRRKELDFKEKISKVAEVLSITTTWTDKITDEKACQDKLPTGILQLEYPSAKLIDIFGNNLPILPIEKDDTEAKHSPTVADDEDAPERSRSLGTNAHTTIALKTSEKDDECTAPCFGVNDRSCGGNEAP